MQEILLQGASPGDRSWWKNPSWATVVLELTMEADNKRIYRVFIF